MADKVSVKNRLRALLDPLVAVFERMGVSPLSVTLAGLVVSLAGALLVARGSLAAGGAVLLVGSICDTIDGSLARRRGEESAFGAFIDSTIDRVTELACFGGLVFHFAGVRARRAFLLGAFGGEGAGGNLRIILLLVAMGGSFLTSYTRARAEGLGLECRVGLIERPERLALLLAGLFFGGAVLDIVIASLALLTVVSAVQRIVHVRRLTAAGVARR